MHCVHDVRMKHYNPLTSLTFLRYYILYVSSRRVSIVLQFTQVLVSEEMERCLGREKFAIEE